MNTDSIRAEVEHLLDEAAAKYPEGIKSDDLRREVREAVASLVAETDRDVAAETEALVLSVQRHSRKARRTRMSHDIGYILDAFAEDESGAYVDPMLDLAYPIGTEDGEVKTLRYWTADNFETSTRMAYRKAAEITAAARDHDERMQAAVRSMRMRGVEQFGQAS